MEGGEESGPVRRARGRPRAPGVEDKILHAALDEYTEHGWAGFTMDAVARRAGVGKSTVYLRWHDKDSLLTDAVRMQSLQISSIDTGSLRGDLMEFTTTVVEHVVSPEGWANLRVIMDTASTSERLGRFTEEATTIRRAAMATIFDRAKERGEIGPDVEPNALTELIYGAAFMFALGRRLEHVEASPERIERRVGDLVTVLLDGLRPR